MELFFESPPGSRPRGLFFDLILGIEGPIDAESGMILNLVEVDRVLESLSGAATGEAWTDPAEALRSWPRPLGSALERFPAVRWRELVLRRFDGSSWSIRASDPERVILGKRSVRNAIAEGRTREKIIETFTDDGVETARSEARPAGEVLLKISK